MYKQPTGSPEITEYPEISVIIKQEGSIEDSSPDQEQEVTEPLPVFWSDGQQDAQGQDEESDRLIVTCQQTKDLPSLSFPVVGIGTSAGGLEAFMDLLKHLSPTINMAFVIVQHLDPDYESKLCEILDSDIAASGC